MKNLFTAKTQQVIGLDIGTRFVKAVVLEKSGNQYSLQAFACEPILGNAFAEREIKDFEAVSHALKKVKLVLKSKNKWVAIAVSGSAVLNKIVFMEPGLSDHELESQIELEADSLIPYPLNEVYIDFEEMSSPSSNNRVSVLLSAVHRDLVDRRITLLGEVGYQAKIVDVESYALGNALQTFYAQGDSKEENLCCINIGATHLQMCVLAKGQIIYTKDHSFGMDALVNDLAQLYSQDRQQIEQQLSDGSLPENWQQEAYPMFITNLQQNINRAIQLYISSTGAKRPELLLVCGGTGLLSTLVTDLTSELGLQVTAFNPFSSMQLDESLSLVELDKVAGQLVIAAGLASRSFQPWHI